MQDITGRGDGIAGVEQAQAAFLAGGYQSQREGMVAHDIAIGARRQDRLGDPISGLYQPAGAAEIVPGLERPLVGFNDLGARFELVLDKLDGIFHRAVVQPVEQSQGKHVGGAGHYLAAEPQTLQRPFHHKDHIDAHHGMFGQGIIFQGVGLPLSQLQIALVKGGTVGDYDPVRAQLREVDFQGGRIHYYQHVGSVPWSLDIFPAELDLVGTHTGQGTSRGADFGGIVRQGGQVVPYDSGRLSELAASQLHPIAGITGEPDGDLVDFLDRFPGPFLGLAHGLFFKTLPFHLPCSPTRPPSTLIVTQLKHSVRRQSNVSY